MLNLFVLIIWSKFQDYYLDPNNPLNDYKEDVTEFREIWALYTQINYGICIDYKYLIEFVCKLSP